MDAIIKVQLTEDRTRSAQDYVRAASLEFRKKYAPYDLEFSFDSGGLIRGALNEGNRLPSTFNSWARRRAIPRETTRTPTTSCSTSPRISSKPCKESDGIADARVLEKNDAPEFMITVNRVKAADAGLTRTIS